MEAPGWLMPIWGPIAPYAEKLAIWRGYENDLRTLLIYAVGIAVYTALVFAFYQNLSKRDAFTLKHRPGFWGRLLHAAETSLLFPLMSFLYFGVLAVSLFVLAKSQTTNQILLLSMAVVVGVRVTSFVSEGAAVDLAKMLPLALLGVLIVDPSYASLQNTWAHFAAVPSLTPLLLRYFVLFIVLEGALRIATGTLRRVTGKRKKERPSKAQLADEVRHVAVKGGAPELTRER